jgi:hypothetical protein
VASVLLRNRSRPCENSIGPQFRITVLSYVCIVRGLIQEIVVKFSRQFGKGRKIPGDIVRSAKRCFMTAIQRRVIVRWGGHQAAGFNFVLFHDIPFSGHEAAGFNFVLPHDLPGTLDFDARPLVFDGGVPVGGWSHLTLRQDGSLTFTGHFHDSGATEYNMNFIFAVKDSQNIVYTVQHSGRVFGTFESGSRDDDWTIDTRNDRLADNWANLAAGSTWVANGSAKMDGTDLFNSVIGVIGTVVGVISLFTAGSSAAGAAAA